METELQLLNAIRSGEKEAKRRLYERFAGLAAAIAQRYIPQHDEVRDVLQDSFVKILTSLDRFQYRQEGSLKAWVATIVTHEAIQHLRAHERNFVSSSICDEPIDEEPDVGRVPPEVLNKLLGQLPVGYRMVLNLYVFEQMSHNEIAQLLGIKPNSSASQYSRAKNALAKLINNYLKNNTL